MPVKVLEVMAVLLVKMAAPETAVLPIKVLVLAVAVTALMAPPVSVALLPVKVLAGVSAAGPGGRRAAVGRATYWSETVQVGRRPLVPMAACSRLVRAGAGPWPSCLIARLHNVEGQLVVRLPPMGSPWLAARRSGLQGEWPAKAPARKSSQPKPPAPT